MLYSHHRGQWAGTSQWAKTNFSRLGRLSTAKFCMNLSHVDFDLPSNSLRLPSILRGRSHCQYPKRSKTVFLSKWTFSWWIFSILLSEMCIKYISQKFYNHKLIKSYPNEQIQNGEQQEWCVTSHIVAEKRCLIWKFCDILIAGSLTTIRLIRDFWADPPVPLSVLTRSPQDFPKVLREYVKLYLLRWVWLGVLETT